MHYLVNKQHDYTVRGYLESRRSRDLRCRIDLLYYHQLPKLRQLPATTYIFSDHERLSENQTQLAITLWNQLFGRPGVRLLNDPSRVARRYPLLRSLHELGRNDFNVYRLDEPLQGLRFPVFVREEREHYGSLSGLLHSHEELRSELGKWLSRLQKYRSRDLIIVEFCDTRDRQGNHAKYSAVRIGRHIIPRYLQLSSDWEVKASNAIVTQEFMEREVRYFEENPHEDWIREIFDLANIDYGRIDYGMLAGRPQVWEVNTNPMMSGMPKDMKPIQKPGPRKEMLEPGRRLSHQRIRHALESIESAVTAQPKIPVQIPSKLVRKLRREEISGQLTRPWEGLKRLLNSLLPADGPLP